MQSRESCCHSLQNLSLAHLLHWPSWSKPSATAGLDGCQPAHCSPGFHSSPAAPSYPEPPGGPLRSASRNGPRLGNPPGDGASCGSLPRPSGVGASAPRGRVPQPGPRSATKLGSRSLQGGAWLGLPFQGAELPRGESGVRVGSRGGEGSDLADLAG